jgi:hypothetical protein
MPRYIPYLQSTGQLLGLLRLHLDLLSLQSGLHVALLLLQLRCQGRLLRLQLSHNLVISVMRQCQKKDSIK